MNDGLLVSVSMSAICLILGFSAGSVLSQDKMKEKQHTEKVGCEYVEQAPCKIIYIKDEK